MPGPEEEIKIILNASSIAGLVEAFCETFQATHERGVVPDNMPELIALLNKIENDVIKLDKLLLKGVKYRGDVGKMLE
jgi:hypothetical protein